MMAAPTAFPLNVEIVNADVHSLNPHPLSQEIYGDEPSAAFVQNVKAQGIIEPLIVTTDDQIISGHRRWQAAKKAGLKEVPVRKVSIPDEKEREQLLLDSNRQREKSLEQRLREFEHYFEIEKTCAKSRRGKRTDLRTDLSTGSGGRARDFAAKKVGLSGTHAETGLKVLHELDGRRDSEEAPLAEKVRDVLNRDGIHAAHREALKAGWIKKEVVKGTNGASAPKAAPRSSDRPLVVTETKAPAAHRKDDDAPPQPSVVKSDLLTKIQRETVRGLEMLEVSQLQKFMTDISGFKAAWLEKLKEDSAHA